jgi:hypothetical protein
MHKLAITVAATMVMIFAGGLAWKADATTSAGVGGLTPLTKNYSPIEKVCVATPAGTFAEPSAGARDGMEAFAFGTTRTPPNGAGEEESGVRALLTSPARFCSNNPA